MGEISEKIKKELFQKKNPIRAKLQQGYFKTKKSEYGYGDIFLGITVPEQRLVAKKFKDAQLQDIASLLKTGIHECRFTALEILVMQYEEAKNDVTRKGIYECYLANKKYINNWDLVDTSAHYIVGDYLIARNKKILYDLIKSHMLWDRRIALVATYAFIKQNLFSDTLELSKLVLNDKQDLIHKASGWMLREVGKRSLQTLEEFLNEHAPQMPRTMLRYALEKFLFDKRKKYLLLK